MCFASRLFLTGIIAAFYHGGVTALECCFDWLLVENDFTVFLISVCAPLLLNWRELCLVSVMAFLYHFMTTFKNRFFDFGAPVA